MKLIMVFGLSILLAVICTNLLLGIAYILLHSYRPVMYWLSDLQRNYGREPFIYTSEFVMFIVFFFLIAGRYIKYIQEIYGNVEEIEKGRLDVEIPVKSSDELGQLADKINNMAAHLKKSIEDERNTEQAKTDLITSVSHDLRTPLTSILGYLGLITNGRYKDETELIYYADVAYRKSVKLKRLIDELFEFTRLSSNGMNLKLSDFDLGEMLEQLAADFYPIFQEAGMECRLSIPQGQNAITADSSMLARVFENLIANAVRYGAEGKYIDIRLQHENGRMAVEIVNYGIPIPQYELPHIFEKFYRVEHSRSQDTGGTGLGLAIAKNIVELHGGSISVSSSMQNTTFKVVLSRGVYQ